MGRRVAFAVRSFNITYCIQWRMRLVHVSNYMARAPAVVRDTPNRTGVGSGGVDSLYQRRGITKRKHNLGMGGSTVSLDNQQLIHYRLHLLY